VAALLVARVSKDCRLWHSLFFHLCFVDHSQSKQVSVHSLSIFRISHVSHVLLCCCTKKLQLFKFLKKKKQNKNEKKKKRKKQERTFSLLPSDRRGFTVDWTNLTDSIETVRTVSVLPCKNCFVAADSYVLPISCYQQLISLSLFSSFVMSYASERPKSLK
jgi:hypothetical protein